MGLPVREQRPFKDSPRWEEVRRAWIEKGHLTENQLKKMKNDLADSPDLVEFVMAVEEEFGNGSRE